MFPINEGTTSERRSHEVADLEELATLAGLHHKLWATLISGCGRSEPTSYELVVLCDAGNLSLLPKYTPNGQRVAVGVGM